MQKTTKSKSGNAVYARLGIWKEGDEIHLTIPEEPGFHTTVNNKDGSIRCHKNLYKKLERLLRKT